MLGEWINTSWVKTEIRQKIPCSCNEMLLIIDNYRCHWDYPSSRTGPTNSFIKDSLTFDIVAVGLRLDVILKVQMLYWLDVILKVELLYWRYSKAIAFEDVNVAQSVMLTRNPKEMKTLGKNIQKFHQETLVFWLNL